MFFIKPKVQRCGLSASAAALCCVPGTARLLNGTAQNYDTGFGQSPDSGRWRRRVAKGKGICRKACLKEAPPLRDKPPCKSAGRCAFANKASAAQAYRHAPYRQGRGQAYLRRDEAGTRPGHRTKSSIRHGSSRISDPAAAGLKVTDAHRGRPAASRRDCARWDIYSHGGPAAMGSQISRILHDEFTQESEDPHPLEDNQAV